MYFYVIYFYYGNGALTAECSKEAAQRHWAVLWDFLLSEGVDSDPPCDLKQYYGWGPPRLCVELDGRAGACTRADQQALKLTRVIASSDKVDVWEVATQLPVRCMIFTCPNACRPQDFWCNHSLSVFTSECVDCVRALCAGCQACSWPLHMTSTLRAGTVLS